MLRLPNPDFWQGRRVFLTGHTGFKGGWLAVWLKMLGAEPIGYSLAPDTAPALYDVANIGDVAQGVFADVRDAASLTAALADASPSVVFHLAAQPLVRQSYAAPRETFETNLLGTVNLLDAARATPGIGAIVIVTTDKCYENFEHAWPYRETDRLGGRDPYSASKACAELATAAYQQSFFTAGHCGVATLRAGNVIGGGDWSADRLLPDIARAFAAGQPVVLRNPDATRPWQHVLEPLNGYLIAAEKIFGRAHQTPLSWNLGPDMEGIQTVATVAGIAARAWGDGAELVVRPDQGAPHEAKLLSLDNFRARTELGWSPRWTLAQAVSHTIAWYRDYGLGADALHLCRTQIDTYMSNSRDT